jgi:hypothetical protein
MLASQPNSWPDIRDDGTHAAAHLPDLDQARQSDAGAGGCSAMQETLLNLRRDGPALPARATRMLAARVAKCPWPLPNVWLGTSIECDEYSWRGQAHRRGV